MNRYEGIHSAVVLVHTGETDFPIRVQGESGWIEEPTDEEYRRGMVAQLIRDGIENIPVTATESNLRVVELNFTLYEKHEEA